eukprot:CAMPEP_0168792998 /NCGR_PEP_ID=MMETSP0725-20121227/14839_1 /TAXON_ID=265536 /ORGANISM="Amphiprora sp., Strain CCMP467" /LENGTH=62 /DNA_ID=CAMNT_0008843721 /DNA_START=255 /DNA_END=439 /DNA_ORIENTATION=+
MGVEVDAHNVRPHEHDDHVGAKIFPKHVHKRFASVEAYVRELAGDKARVITKVLIANNGVAA